MAKYALDCLSCHQLDQLEAINRVQNLNDICEDLKAEISEK